MKTITFEGKQYEVPDWVKWCGRAVSYSIYCFDVRPKVIGGHFYCATFDSRIFVINDNDFKPVLIEV